MIDEATTLRIANLQSLAENPRGFTKTEIAEAVWHSLESQEALIRSIKEMLANKERDDETMIGILSRQMRGIDSHDTYPIRANVVSGEGLKLRAKGKTEQIIPFATILHDYLEPLDYAQLHCDTCNKPLFHVERDGKIRGHEHQEPEGREIKIDGETETIEDSLKDRRKRAEQRLMGTNNLFPIQLREDGSCNQRYQMVYPEDMPEYVPPPTPSFDFALDDWNSFRNLVAVASTIAEEGTFDFDSESLRFRQMDPSHVSMADAVMYQNGFAKYEANKADRFTVRLEDLQKKLRGYDRKDSLSVHIAEGDMQLKVSGEEDTLHLIESPTTSTPQPKLTFTTKFLMSVADARDLLKKCEEVGNHITIEANPTNFIFTSKGDSGTKLIKKESMSLQAAVEKDSKSTYSLEHLTRLFKAYSQTKEYAAFEFSSNMPMRITLPLGTQGQLQFYLAPRVQE